MCIRDRADPDHGDAYARNGEEAAGQLPSFAGDCTQALAGAEGAALITFHDGFRYFAQALGLPLLASIEEEEGSEASACLLYTSQRQQHQPEGDHPAELFQCVRGRRRCLSGQQDGGRDHHRAGERLLFQSAPPPVSYTHLDVYKRQLPG